MYHKELLYRWLFGLLLAATALGWLAPWSWIAELSTHFAWQYCIASVVFAVLFMFPPQRYWIAAAGLVFVYHLSHILPLYFTPDASSATRVTGQIRLVQFNVNSANTRTAEIIEWIVAENFDLVLLQEVSPAFARQLAMLGESYPYQIVTAREDSFGSALISRRPFLNANIVPFAVDANHYIRTELQVGSGGQVRFYGLHSLPPTGSTYAALRNIELRVVASAIKSDPSELKILAGDLNVTPYSPYFDDLLEESGLQNSMLGYGPQNSWPSFFLLNIFRLPIDHVLTTPRITVAERSIGPSFGSDHHPVITVLSLR